MLEEENQNSKEQEETLNLTGKELEEYKTYLKFKNEIEKQNESQEAVQVKSQNITQNQNEDNKPNANSTTKSFEKEIDITDMDDPNYTFDEEFIEKTGYKDYFMQPIDIKSIEAFRNELVRVILINSVGIYLVYWGTSERNGIGWIIFKIIVGFVAMKHIVVSIKRLIAIEPISAIKHKIYNYNAILRDADWVKISEDDENFKKYYDITKGTIKNKLHLIYTRPRFKRDKYTEVYHIVNSNIFVVYGIYDSVGYISEGYVGYMLVIENDECVLNLIAGTVLRKKK